MNVKEQRRGTRNDKSERSHCLGVKGIRTQDDKCGRIRFLNLKDPTVYRHNTNSYRCFSSAVCHFEFLEQRYPDCGEVYGVQQH
jgi:hypothetical protein